jgi:hypothetical protein
MAKIEEASKEVINLFDEVRNNTTIPLWIEFGVLNCKKLKQLYKIVKISDVVEPLTDGIDFAIVFNEEILEQLTKEQQKMAIDECLAGISVSETDVVSFKKCDFNTYRGVLEKYNHTPIIVLHESIKSLFDVKKQKEIEAKNNSAPKGKRGKKPKINNN